MSTVLAEANKRFVAELNSLIGREVLVALSNGEVYRGVLHAVDTQLNILLTNAVDKSGNKFQKTFIMSRYIIHLDSAEDRINLRELAKYLEKVFPGMVRYVEETNTILVGDKVRVSDIGVEGVGPVAERVKRAFEDYLKQRGSS